MSSFANHLQANANGGKCTWNEANSHLPETISCTFYLRGPPLIIWGGHGAKNKLFGPFPGKNLFKGHQKKKQNKKTLNLFFL